MAIKGDKRSGGLALPHQGRGPLAGLILVEIMPKTNSGEHYGPFLPYGPYLPYNWKPEEARTSPFNIQATGVYVHRPNGRDELVMMHRLWRLLREWGVDPAQHLSAKATDLIAPEDFAIEIDAPECKPWEFWATLEKRSRRWAAERREQAATLSPAVPLDPLPILADRVGKEAKLLWLKMYLDTNRAASTRDIETAAKALGHKLPKSSVNRILRRETWIGHPPRQQARQTTSTDPHVMDSSLSG